MTAEVDVDLLEGVGRNNELVRGAWLALLSIGDMEACDAVYVGMELTHSCAHHAD